MIKVSSYKSNNIYTYGLGATVAMEYLLKKREDVRAVILHPSFRSEETIEKIGDICGKDIPVSTEEKPFNILSKKDNCFVICVIEKKTTPLRAGDHMVLVNPSNCGNLGTITRSCLGFGVRDIAIVGKTSADPFDPKTIRASMGACASVRIEVFERFGDYASRFPANNLYPFMLDGSTKLQETTIKRPFSLIMGNEATGLDPAFKDIGKPIRIEHSGDIDSLNITIAASIGLYEATKSCE
ncbi:TrmH family RNA methyltransferase [Butyrivibrio sp. AE2032]|uniref:TrmH family RNA methyltransferase n=1 Tax=Butyrivibrio sp. AE2032 TaxID=1458463 RepID=UPI00068E723F|nr:TrmH family RNA methyltransferase [Butyrivibrio sp. AE2032]